jgi:hypothetical protein
VSEFEKNLKVIQESSGDTELHGHFPLNFFTDRLNKWHLNRGLMSLPGKHHILGSWNFQPRSSLASYLFLSPKRHVA